MTKLEYEKFKEHILEHFDDAKTFKEELDCYIKEAKGNIYQAAYIMCQYGCFDIYYNDCLETLKDVYGDDFDESKYITKDEAWRYKNNEAYIWTVYKAKIARAIDMMYKKGEL